MKILYVCTVELSKNGIVTWLLNYSRALKKIKPTTVIDLVTPCVCDSECKKTFESLNVRIIEICHRKSNPLRYSNRLYHLMKTENYDIIHIHGNSAIVIIELITAFLAKCKTRIVHSHNTKTEYPIIDHICRPLFNKFYTDAMACSEAAGKWLFRDSEFTVIRNGIDMKMFSFNSNTREKIRAELGIKDHIVVGHIGLFEKVKNHDFLIDVIRKVKDYDSDFKLLLIGDGSLKEYISQKIFELDLESNVILLGKTDKVCDYLQAFDILAFPSLYEGLPYVLIEAQASGTACLVSDNVSKEVKLTEECKLLPLDKDIWVNEILKYVKNRNEVKKMTKLDNRLLVYDINSNAVDLYRYYQNIL